MSNKIHLGSFDQLISQYTIKTKRNTRKYHHNSISNLLVEDRTTRLLRHALGSSDRKKRIAAIVELGKWANTSFEVEVLTRMSLNEPDLELRYYATEAIVSIQSRIM